MTMLEGLRVLELSDGLVDLGGRMLSELGAEVISIGVTHSPRTHRAELAWGHGKLRVEATADDLPAVLSLLKGADVLLDGRRSGSVIDLDDAAGQDERLVHVIARPFSTDGPWASRPATDLTLMAQSGLMTIVGEPDRPPLRLPGEQAYALTGIQIATAALLGLQARRRTGRGQRIDVSALQCATLANYREAIMYEWTGRIGFRTGNRLVRGKSGVRQVWPSADGYVTWSMIDNPGMMRSVVAVMREQGVAGELEEVDWDAILVADLAQETVDRWQDIFAAFYASHSGSRLLEWSLVKGWGLSVIADIDAVRNSAHLQERGLFTDVRDASTGRTASLPGPLFLHGEGDDRQPAREFRQAVAIGDVAGWRSR